mmetsp:Transcript_76940/g.193513  ORF Transcript_76940/g.193513 Transcript_76940/m.193513 type:complete len:709 (+) Transcript_76940:71-2197(+)
MPVARSPIVAMLVAALLASLTPVASTTKAQMMMRQNPIRRVVKMLQEMQKKVTEEGEQADELYDKYMCYCKGSGGDLATSIETAKTKLEELGPAIEAAISKKDQLEKDLISHQKDKSAAQQAIEEATAIREKEAATFDKELAENKANVAALSKAIDALGKGMAGSFLQTGEAGKLRAFLVKNAASLDGDHQQVLSFLSGEQGDESAPSTGEILGIITQMKDEMSQDQKDMIAAEKAAVETYNGLMEAKRSEGHALSKAIGDKLDRTGNLGMEIAEMKNELGDSTRTLAKDTQFAAALKKNCASKQAAHEEEKEMRAKEVVALADTIKILNDDDSLELFKTTLPSGGASFLQLQTTTESMRAEVKGAVNQVRSKVRPGHGAERLDFISLALSGRKVGLDKVVKLVKQLVATLKEEQNADDRKKEYCGTQLATAKAKKKALQRSVSDLSTAIEQIKERIATLTEDIAVLKKGILALDKSVAEATEQRKKENAEYRKVMANNAAAKEVILRAKKSLRKFYRNSFLQTATPQEDGDAGMPVGPSFVQTQESAVPPANSKPYVKKSAAAVFTMLDVLLSDLDREMKFADREEKDSQEEYEKTMADSQEKRAIDLTSMRDKQGAKADLEGQMEVSHAETKSAQKGVQATETLIQTLHSDCDWLMQYYVVRKEARTDEIDGLVRSMGILDGADYAFIQLGATHARTHRFLSMHAA